MQICCVGGNCKKFQISICFLLPQTNIAKLSAVSENIARKLYLNLSFEKLQKN
jgi:hypothetical protein